MKTKALYSKVICIALALVLAFGCIALSGCGSSERKSDPISVGKKTSSDAGDEESATEEAAAATEPGQSSAASEFVYDGKTTAVEIDVKDYGKIIVDLYDDLAPITVENFKKLVSEKFYDGLTFHRIIKGFMIQGGDPQGTGMGGSGTNIKGEFSSNGVQNDLPHTRGVISMARSNDPDSASSQFFIMHQDASHLDGQYAAFGKVREGMDVVDAIAENTPVTDSNGTVEKDKQPVINSIKIIEE